MPEFKHFKIASSGKYLGWVLSRNGIMLPFEAPLAKFKERVQDVVSGNASAPCAILRYNQRWAPVLSYVAQFAHPERKNKNNNNGQHSIDIPAREQNAIHRILRLPPQSMSRSLMQAVGLYSAVAPTRLVHNMSAIMVRFANSERQ